MRERFQELVATYNNFTPREHAYYFARLRGIRASDAKPKAEQTLRAVDLWELLSAKRDISLFFFFSLLFDA
jgi:ABC-type multidrug transport system ATPase subunit